MLPIKSHARGTTFPTNTDAPETTHPSNACHRVLIIRTPAGQLIPRRTRLMFLIENALFQAGYVTAPDADQTSPGRVWYPKNRYIPAPAADALIRVTRESEIELVELQFVDCERGEPPVPVTKTVFPSVECMQGWLRRFSR